MSAGQERVSAPRNIARVIDPHSSHTHPAHPKQPRQPELSGRSDQRLSPQVLDAFERSQKLVVPVLRHAVDRLHPTVRLMAEFSFGWREADGTPRRQGTGKGLRPALAMLSAGAAGAPPQRAAQAAAAVELVHAFSLVHDDIMDNDEQRRHRASVWKAFGVGPAVLAGDALLALAVAVVAEIPGADVSAAPRLLAQTLLEIVNGQADDLAFASRPWSGPQAVTVAEYTTMAERKTGSLLGCAAGLGALSAAAPPDTITALTAMGKHLGIAFQAVDDLLGIWGDPTLTGKPLYSDLREQKKTLPILFALASTHPAAEQLRDRLTEQDKPRPSSASSSVSGDGRDDARLRHAAGLVEVAGGRTRTVTHARQRLEEVRRIIDVYAADTHAGAALTHLAEFVITRAH